MTNLEDITFDKGLDRIVEYLKKENHKDGLLSDVCGIIVGEKTDSRPEVPYLWVIEEDITVYDELDNFDYNFLKTPITVYAVCFDPDDLEQSYKDSKNLAARAGASMEKGHSNDKDPFFSEVFFNNFSPRGVEIEGAANVVHQSSIQYNCILVKDKLYGKNKEELGLDKVKVNVRVKYEKKLKKRRRKEVKS
jgi:hypothetical protein